MELESLIVDYDKGCIVATLEGGKSVTIPLNGVEFAAVSLKLKEPEYDMPTLGKKLKEFHDLLHNNLPRNNIPDWLKEFIDSPRFSKGKDHEQAVSKLLSDARKKIKAQLGDVVSLALLPKSNKLVTYPLEKIRFMGRLPVYNVSVTNRVPGMMLSNDGTEIDLMPEGIEGELKIPEGVTKLWGDIFKKCKKITSILIPKSVRTIDLHIFSDCNKLERIEVAKENIFYVSVNGILLYYHFGKYVTYSTEYEESFPVKVAFVPRGMKGDVQIPESVTEIGYGAFEGCTGLTSIAIPESVTKIGDYAFSGCTGLTSIAIPESVTKIGDYAFRGCTGLTSITIPESVTGIGGCAFEGCTGLTSITILESVTEIGRDAFSGCTGLTSITIPKGVTRIDSHTFYGCTGLTSITILESVTEIGRDAFSGCTGLERIEVAEENPEYKSVNGILFNEAGTELICVPGGIKGLFQIPESVTKIGKNAFSGCAGLTSITIPESVTEIGEWVFSGCTGLKSITIPESVTEIGCFAFSGCTGLTSIKIPKSVTEIRCSAFRGCTGLTSIKIPESVTEIGCFAFSGCTGLTSIKIPKSVTKIGDGAFEGCTGLTSITIPKGVTKIGDCVFWGCTGLGRIEVAEGNSVYKSVNGMLLDKEETKLLFVTNGKKTITIPKKVIEIRAGAFSGCSELEHMEVEKGNKAYYKNADGALLNKESTKIYFVPRNAKGLFQIPESVTGIGDCAFKDCTGLKCIIISECVRGIGFDAFENCTSLKKVYFEGDAPNYVGSAVFENVYAIVYYRKETKGWRETFGELPTQEIDE